MTTTLLPQSFWFRLALDCPRVDGVPKAGGTKLLGLPSASRLPETTRLDGKAPWAEVRAGWNPRGLAVEVAAEGDLEGLDAADRPDALYGLHLWIDTRDTRDVSRATRFCHRFEARLVRGKAGKGLGVTVLQRPIARALNDAPSGGADAVTSRVDRVKSGWRLELFFAAAGLHGYDPENNRRLGLAYQVSHPGQDDQFLGVGREFPVGENPSLWSTLSLNDG